MRNHNPCLHFSRSTFNLTCMPAKASMFPLSHQFWYHYSVISYVTHSQTDAPGRWCPCACSRRWRGRPAGCRKSGSDLLGSLVVVSSGLCLPGSGPHFPSNEPGPPTQHHTMRVSEWVSEWVRMSVCVFLHRAAGSTECKCELTLFLYWKEWKMGLLKSPL